MCRLSYLEKGSCSEREEREWVKQEWKAIITVAFGIQISVDPKALVFTIPAAVAIYMPHHLVSVSTLQLTS